MSTDGKAATDSGWRTADQSRLDGLLDHVPNRETDSGTNPWQPGYTMQIYSLGGSQSLERERIAIVGRNGYNSYVAGNREITTESQNLVCEASRTILVRDFRPSTLSTADVADAAKTMAGSVTKNLEGSRTVEDEDDPAESSGSEPHGDVSWGHDRLHVEGTASIRYRTRTVMAKGRIDRTWNGGVVRLSPLEGVTVGGFFTRAVGGVSLSLSGMMTGDVYGGAARTSACRVFAAVLHYRATKAAAWACGAYCRFASFTIEPLFMKAQEQPKGKIRQKLQRLQKLATRAFKLVRWLAPPLDILWGLLSIAALLITGPFLLFKFIKNYKKEMEVPPLGPPRVHNTNALNYTRVQAQAIHL